MYTLPLFTHHHMSSCHIAGHSSHCADLCIYRLHSYQKIEQKQTISFNGSDRKRSLQSNRTEIPEFCGNYEVVIIEIPLFAYATSTILSAHTSQL
ncbi:MAG: hypothetical protein ABF476_06285, partial [Bifidobacterium aquikefiri]